MNWKDVALIFFVIYVILMTVIGIILFQSYTNEHDLRVVECHGTNTIIELSNMMLPDYGVKELEYMECEEPFDKSILIKLKEIENE